MAVYFITDPVLPFPHSSPIYHDTTLDTSGVGYQYVKTTLTTTRDYNLLYVQPKYMHQAVISGANWSFPIAIFNDIPAVSLRREDFLNKRGIRQMIVKRDTT